MQLRERVSLHWPPAWGGAVGSRQKLLTGEDGTLVSVHIQRDQQTGEEYLVLENDYENARYSGLLNIPDPLLRARVLEILRASMGQPISKIGSIEI
jgi:hypothetical protein